MNLKGKTAIVFGGHGLLGETLVNKLLWEKGMSVNRPTHKQLDVRDQFAVFNHIKSITSAPENKIVFNCFVSFGGIKNNEKHPGSIFYDNLQGNINIIEGSRRAGVGKLIQISSQCVYGDEAPVPFLEHEVWDYGLPTKNNAPYGISKRVLHLMIENYRKEFGFNCITLIPSNMYGPNDNFHPEHTHVIPALIRRFIEAKEKGLDIVSVWGDSKPTREFLYADDCADAIILAAEKYDISEPVNIGTGKEISIWELAELIGKLTGYQGKITFGDSALNGQARRVSDVSSAKESFGFEAKTNLEQGLEKTIEYFLQNRNSLREKVYYA